MSRLQIRVYRALNQPNRWAMVGASTSQDQVRSWIEEYSYKGLILHTGFSVLPREVFVYLLPHTREGIVACAATKTLLPDVFRGMSVDVCHGENDEGEMPLSHIDSWFFLLKPYKEPVEDPSDLWLVSSVTRRRGDEVNFTSNSELQKLSTEIREALEGRSDLVTCILKASILNLYDFRANWSNLDGNQSFEVARLLYGYGIEKFNQRYELGHDSPKNELKHCLGIIHLVRYLPPWAAEVPREPVRTYNALTSNNYTQLYDLENERPHKLLRIPNIGKRSLRLLYEYLINFQVPYPSENYESTEDNVQEIIPQDSSYDETQSKKESFDLKNASTLPDAVATILNEELARLPNDQDGRPLELLKRRLAGETLEGIAETQGLTRERIRQITDQALRIITAKVVNTIANPDAPAHLLLVMKQLFSRDDCSHVDFSNFVRIFSEGSTVVLGVSQRRIIEKMVPGQNVRLVPFELASKSVVLPLNAEHSDSITDSLEGEIASILDTINGMKVREAEDYARNCLLGLIDSRFFASLLATEIVYYRSTIDEHSGCVTRVVERIGSKQAISEIVNILRRAGRPLHGIEDIYPIMPQVYQEAVGPRRVKSQINEHQEKCPGYSEDYIFTMGRGRYALWEHFGIEDSDGKESANFIERHLNKHAERQFTDVELYKILKHEGMVTWNADHVDRHRIVSVILMRYRPSQVRYLGRFVWGAGSWTDQRDTASRYQISDLIEDAIKEKGQPVSKQYIDNYISSTRGKGITAQYHETNGLVRLTGIGKNALYWHESMDPIPFDSPQSKLLRDEIIELVRNSSDSGLYMTGLKADIVSNSDIVSQYNPAQFLAFLLRIPEIKVSKNAFNKLLVTLAKGAKDA